MPETPVRFVRIADDLWDKAARKARDEGTDLSKVIRAALEEFVADEEPTLTEMQRLSTRLQECVRRYLATSPTNT